MARKIMGIDLGTTNTCVALFQDGKPVVVPNAEGSRTTPSVVAFTEKGEVLVGTAARRQAVTNPKRTVHSVKRLMGQAMAGPDVGRLVGWLGYDIVADERGQVAVKTGARDHSPVELSAMLLKAVKMAVTDYLGEECTDAVITCPAYFDDQQRQATYDAARVAGLNVLRLVNEPTAAALAYGWDKRTEGIVAVYDWGGGTFDCSILECSAGVLQVKATHGNSFLGGNDIDEKLMGVLVDHFYRVHGVDLATQPMAMQRLREAAETAKMELSSSSETEIILPFLHTDASGPKHLEMTLTRTRFEQIVADLVSRTLDACRLALEDAGLSPFEVTEVLIVGGSTKMPIVQQRLSEFFGKPPRRGVSADEAVAVGAALQGGILAGDIEDVLLLDVLPLSLGIAEGERFAPILRRNGTIPTFRSDTFSTTRDYQGSVLIKVFQGESAKVRENKLIGVLRLENLPPRRAGEVKIEVTFSVDQNGLLQVEAHDTGSGLRRSVKIRDSMKLSEGEIERLSRQIG